MAVIIKNMEMPESCLWCPVVSIIDGHTLYCNINHHKYGFDLPIPDDCPLIDLDIPDNCFKCMYGEICCIAKGIFEPIKTCPFEDREVKPWQ